MKEERILTALNQVDEKYIKEADPMNKTKKVKKKNNWLKWGSVAACLCLVAVGMLAIPRDNNPSTPPIDGTEEIAYSFTLEGEDTIYSPISFSQRKLFDIVDENAAGLTEENTYQITSDDLGEVMGVVGNCDNEELIGATVYYFVKYPTDNSICIVDFDGIYHFYVKEGIIGIIENNAIIDAPVDEENYQDADPNAPVEYGTATHDAVVNPIIDAPVDESTYQDADPNAPVEYGTGYYETETTEDKDYHESVGSDNLTQNTADFFGGSYTNASGKLVVVLTVDTAENRAAIYEELGVNEGDVLFETGTYTLKYLTDLHDKITLSMVNKELPSVVSSGVYEMENKVVVLVTNYNEDEMAKLTAFDTVGGALEIKLGEVAYTE